MLRNLLRSLSCVQGEGQRTTEYVKPRLLKPQCTAIFLLAAGALFSLNAHFCIF